MQPDTRYEFKRSRFIDQDISEDVQVLSGWTKDPSEFLKRMNNVVFYVTPSSFSMNNSLEHSPGAMDYFNKLHEEWPFFLHFCYPISFNYEWYLELLCLRVMKNKSTPYNKDVELIRLFYLEEQHKAEQKAEELQIPNSVFEIRKIPMYQSFNAYLAEFSNRDSRQRKVNTTGAESPARTIL